MIDNIEDQEENEELANFEINLDEEKIEIDKNVDNASNNNPEENLKKKISSFIIEIDKNEYTDELVEKTIKVYNELGFNKQNGIDLLKNIFLESSKYSKFNLNKRISDFFDFILNEKGLILENITAAINITNKELDKENNKDIIYFWKKKIVEEYLKQFNIKIKSNMAKDTMKLLLEYNYSISEIKIIFSIFKNIINDENYSHYEIIKSIISIMISYPNEQNIDILKEYFTQINQNINKDEKNMTSSFIFDKKIVLEYYLKVSSNESNKKSSNELSINEIFHQMKIINPDISESVIKKREDQLKIILSKFNNGNSFFVHSLKFIFSKF